ncbi:MAG: hypothetical protein N2314_07645, partial [Brevinematales bacterium]|nr:hypothetical protein [Brevinematales bacterium]
VSKEWGNHVEGEIVCLQNLVDWSGLLVHRLRKQEDDFQWDISFSFGYGNEKSEFGMMVDIFRLEAGMGFFF